MSIWEVIKPLGHVAWGKCIDLTAWANTQVASLPKVLCSESRPLQTLHENGKSLHILKIIDAPFHPWKPLPLLSFPLPEVTPQSVPDS